jgi:hypothetical protein
MGGAGLEFSVGGLLASFVFSVFGIFIFREGKRDANMRKLLLGIVLMTFTYVVGNAWACWGIGLALVGINYFTRLTENN